MTDRPTISFVIVNYNVKEYLDQLLHSLQRALRDISHEIFVVDNASVDDSVAHIRQHFPNVTMIESAENLGFGRANNVALKQVRGEFVVLINPDVVVQEDTFTKLLEFFEKTPRAGAATCKIINPDGSFSVDCRHSIPTPTIALWKVLGLSKLFPRSKIFAKYNLTYLDPEDTYPVPAISGCFMMIRKRILDEVGHFDERFFMYCEDIDLCHRINLAGHQIHYMPDTQIIHYKGESTKKNNVDYVIIFNKALYQFFRKYYAAKTLFLFRWLIIIGIVARGVFIYLRNFLREHFPLILDTIILNLVVVLSFIVRLELKHGFLWENYFSQYWIINLISTIIFIAGSYYLEVYPHHRLSIQGIIKANVLTFILLASLTFFLKQFAFSRMVVLFAAIISPLCMIAWRGLLKRSYMGDKSVWGKDLFSKPTIIVGTRKGVLPLFQKIRDLKDMSYELLGVVTLEGEGPEFEENHIPVLGKIENLADLVKMHRARQVIFSPELLSYEQILGMMSEMGMPQLEYKIAPSKMEVMIGKSSIERLDDYPLLEVEYAIGKPFNRWMKRAMDIAIATVPVMLLTLFCLPLFLLRWRAFKKIYLSRPKSDPAAARQFIYQSDKRGFYKWVDRWLLMLAVYQGKLSLVGAPLTAAVSPASGPIWYKPGLTGLVQLNAGKIQAPDDAEKYHLYYLKNQSLLLDLEILAKAVFGRRQNPPPGR